MYSGRCQLCALLCAVQILKFMETLKPHIINIFQKVRVLRVVRVGDVQSVTVSLWLRGGR